MASSAVSVDGSVLEGLARLLRPEGTFADELRAVGFDVRHPQVRYPASVFLRVQDVCARRACPGRTREEAHRELGQRFVDHFFGTIPGRVASTLLRVLGVKQFLLRLPKVAGMMTSGLEVLPEQVDGELRIVFRGDPDMSPDFTAGAIEGSAHAARFNLHARVVRREVGEFEIRISAPR